MLKRKKGLIVVISAPSGAGKTTLCKRLLQTSPLFTYSVSFTTRPPRKNEIEGVDYYFVSREEFKEMIEKGEFVEWAEVHGQLYGTSAKLLNRVIEGGKEVVLDVDVKGGVQIKKSYPNAVLTFLLPPSWEELGKRLKSRETEEEEKIKRRIERAKKEVEYAPYYDYLVINDDVNKALEDLLAIIKAERCRMSRFYSDEIKTLTLNLPD
jgi:guanylate kinase